MVDEEGSETILESGLGKYKIPKPLAEITKEDVVKAISPEAIQEIWAGHGHGHDANGGHLYDEHGHDHEGHGHDGHGHDGHGHDDHGHDGHGHDDHGHEGHGGHGGGHGGHGHDGKSE